MVANSTLFGRLLGVPVGILLVISGPGHILPNRLIHRIAGLVVNIGRSIPFIILMIAIIPFTRMIAGTSIGTTAAIVPLTVSAIPYVARLVESALQRDRSRRDRSGSEHGRLTPADHLQGAPAREPPDSGARRHHHRRQPRQLLCDGGSHRRRRIGRLGDPLRIPAFSWGHHAPDRRDPRCTGPADSDHRIRVWHDASTIGIHRKPGGGPIPPQSTRGNAHIPDQTYLFRRKTKPCANLPS